MRRQAYPSAQLGIYQPGCSLRLTQPNAAVLREPITSNGHLELRFYLRREQVISEMLHRYRNIVPKPE